MWKFYNPIFEYEKMYDDLGGPWAGHKYFGYDLVRNYKPKKIVELGTHLGCSVFSFAQAVYDGKLTTQLDAIDTWQGDEHSSLYGENIFQRVNEIKKTCYPNTEINFIRKTFDDAVKDYTDNSIDLLHIDGLHTFGAVKHDYETWFPKVKKNGLILLHDSYVKEWGFGIYKLFAKLKQAFKTIEFTHAYGLGVIFKNSDTSVKLKGLTPFLESYYALKSDKAQSEWELKKQLDGYKEQLDRIKSARTYKIWQLYNQLKKKLK